MCINVCGMRMNVWGHGREYLRYKVLAYPPAVPGVAYDMT